MVIRFHYGNSFACRNFHQNHAGSLPVIEWFLLMNTGLNLTCTLSVFQKTPDFMGDLSILLDTGPMAPVVRGGSPTNHRRYPYTIHLLLWGAEMKFPYLVCDRNGVVLSSHKSLESAAKETHVHKFWTYIEHLDETAFDSSCVGA